MLIAGYKLGVYMGFWFFLLAMVLLIPLLMIGFGNYFKNHPPKEINCIFGYRTARSMKSKETWDFAHRHSGRIWSVCGWILLPVSASAMLPVLGKDIDTIGIVGAAVSMAQVFVMIITIIPTEVALKKNFDEDGRRINDENRKTL